MLHVDTLLVRMQKGMAHVSGEVGLTERQSCEIQYTVAIDSLGALSRFFPADTGVVPPRPGILTERMARAREDSIRVARATEVQRAITGQSSPPIVVDTPQVVPRSRVSGAIQAEGTMRGNIHMFSVDGTANGTDLVAEGSSANSMTLRYVWNDIFTPQSYIGVSARAGGVTIAGFALDSISALASYRAPNGPVAFTIQEARNRVYSADATFLTNRVRSDLRLNNLRLRFDSTVYATIHPSLIHFGSAGVDVDDLDIRAKDETSRIFVNGRIPTSGPADAHVNLINFDVANITSLLESDVPARGFLSVDASLTGTAANPVIQGAFGTSRMTYRGTAIPEIHGTLQYANQTLQTTTGANLEGRPSFLRATATVPMNLAINRVIGSRIPTDRALDARIDTDSLPLDHIPQLTDAIADLRGTAVTHTFESLGP